MKPVRRCLLRRETPPRRGEQSRGRLATSNSCGGAAWRSQSRW